MKAKTNKVLTYGLCLLLIPLLQACKEDNHSIQLLELAQQKVERNPSEALNLLNSISNPENMDKSSYMRYIVTRVQAKYKTNQNITNDTLIFEAQKYFDIQNDYVQSALAHYYISCIYYQKELSYKDFEHSRLAEYYARKAGDNFIIAKSLHSIGNVYNDKNVLDSAIIYYKQALEYYDKEVNAEKPKLDGIKALGMAYRKMGKLDDAYNTFNEGYKRSLANNNSEYKITFQHMLGTIYNDKKEYKDADKYLHEALSQTLNPDEKRRIYLSLLMLYNNTNQLDSAGYYAKNLKESLPKITYLYTLQESYSSLSDYYQKVGNYKEVAKYSNLQKDIELTIYQSNNSKLLFEADQRYKDALEKKDAERLHMRNQLLWIGCIPIILSILILVYFRNRHIRQKKRGLHKLLTAELKAKETEINARERIGEQQSKSIEYLQSIYGNIITDWGEIDKKVQTLAKELGTTKEPELYTEIKNVIENFKQNTNQHLIELAKDYLREKPYGEEALSILNDRDLLLFMLYYKEYKRNEVSILLGVNPHKQNMILRKMELKNKLVRVGMPEDRISQILFKEDNLHNQRVALL